MRIRENFFNMSEIGVFVNMGWRDMFLFFKVVIFNGIYIY